METVCNKEKGFVKEHVSLTQRCRRECGDNWRGGGRGAERVGRRGEMGTSATVSTIETKLKMPLLQNIS